MLSGLAETLLGDRRGSAARLTTWQREALQGIDQTAFHLVGLTDELLDAASLQAGRLELSCEPTDLVALCRLVVTRFQRTASQHTLSFDTPLEHLVAQVDPERIEQVLDNLLSNALKYSPEGGPIQVMIRESNEGKMAKLNVADRGIGIPAQQQARIFGRFERADNSRAYGIGGTGLGLYLSHALVEQHGGASGSNQSRGRARPSSCSSHFPPNSIRLISKRASFSSTAVTRRSSLTCQRVMAGVHVPNLASVVPQRPSPALHLVFYRRSRELAIALYLQKRAL